MVVVLTIGVGTVIMIVPVVMPAIAFMIVYRTGLDRLMVMVVMVMMTAADLRP